MSDSTSAPPSSRHSGWLLSAFAAVLIIGFASASQAVVAYSFEGDQLYAVDLENGSFEAMGETSPVFAATATPGGEIYLIIADQAGVPRNHLLVRFDLDTGSASTVGYVAGSEPVVHDLAGDGTGTLWLSAPGGLYAIDLATGTDAFLGPTAQPVHALSYREGVLYGLTVDLVGVARLVSIDPMTGDLMPIRILDLGGFFNDFALEFDPTGTAWISGVYFSPLSAAGPPIRAVWRLSDLETGEPEETLRDNSFDAPLLLSMVILPAGAPLMNAVEVPVLDRTVILVLTLLLAAAGLMATRRL